MLLSLFEIMYNNKKKKFSINQKFYLKIKYIKRIEIYFQVEKAFFLSYRGVLRAASSRSRFKANNIKILKVRTSLSITFFKIKPYRVISKKK